MEKDLTQKGQFLRCLIRLGGGGLTPNETLSHSNGKFVFDHGPYGCGVKMTLYMLVWKVLSKNVSYVEVGLV